MMYVARILFLLDGAELKGSVRWGNIWTGGSRVRGRILAGEEGTLRSDLRLRGVGMWGGREMANTEFWASHLCKHRNHQER